MRGVSAQRIDFLNPQEIQQFGLQGKDRAYEERRMAARAREAGISILEYRRRDARALVICPPPSYTSEAPQWLRCREDILQGRR